VNDVWREALAPTPECLDVVRLGEALTDAERAHVESCARCQSEVALFREFLSDAASADEAEAGQWIAGELQRRLQGESRNVVPIRGKAYRVVYAAAAALLIVIGASYWIDTREPELDERISAPSMYRSARLDVIAPIGDLTQAPNELRWAAVPEASTYSFRILEVDMEPVWAGRTTETHVALPPAVTAQFAPGKTLLWDVTALRGNEELATSETQNVRVKTP
jgi:hypothetical protein